MNLLAAALRLANVILFPRAPKIEKDLTRNTRTQVETPLHTGAGF